MSKLSEVMSGEESPTASVASSRYNPQPVEKPTIKEVEEEEDNSDASFNASGRFLSPKNSHEKRKPKPKKSSNEEVSKRGSISFEIPVPQSRKRKSKLRGSMGITGMSFVENFLKTLNHRHKNNARKGQ